MLPYFNKIFYIFSSPNNVSLDTNTKLKLDVKSEIKSNIMETILNVSKQPRTEELEPLVNVDTLLLQENAM